MLSVLAELVSTVESISIAEGAMVLEVFVRGAGSKGFFS